MNGGKKKQPIPMRDLTIRMMLWHRKKKGFTNHP